MTQMTFDAEFRHSCLLVIQQNKEFKVDLIVRLSWPSPPLAAPTLTSRSPAPSTSMRPSARPAPLTSPDLSRPGLVEDGCSACRVDSSAAGDHCWFRGEITQFACRAPAKVRL